MPDKPPPDRLGPLIEEWRLRFLREGFGFDDISEIGVYTLNLLPFKRHRSAKRGQREFNALPVTYMHEIDPLNIEDYSRACYEHFSRQEKTIMRQSFEEYSMVIFPVIISENVDSIALGYIQRYHKERSPDVEFPVIFDLDLERVYMRLFNPGKGDPFFHPYSGEIENILKG